MMTTTTEPKGNVKDFRAFARKVLAFQPPSKTPKNSPPKARHRISADKKPAKTSTA